MHYSRTSIAVITILASAVSYSSRAAIDEFTDATLWQYAIGAGFSTIDFTGFPHNTFITDQYACHGVHFAGTNLITGPTPGFVNDGWGLYGPAGVWIVFDSPQHWVAIDHPGVAQFELYSGGDLVYTSSLFFHGGLGNFAGMVSSIAFDEVYIFKPEPMFINQVFIDDLHWGGGEPKSPCPEVVADLTGDCSVGVADLLELLAQWGPCRNNRPCPADLTGSGHVDVDDLLLLLDNWG